MKLELLKNKKVLVLGLGREGESSFRFLRKHFPNQIIGLADELSLNKLSASSRGLIEKDKKIKLHLGKNYLRAIKNYDIIIKTPGIPRKLLLPHITSQKITSQTEIFLEKYRDQTIGITGTKGKGTTASLIYKILKDSGRKVKLIGNIGKPALDYFKTGPSARRADPSRPAACPLAPRGAGRGEWFIFEISSHQLEGIKISPHIAVFVNIYPDHLDYFENFKEYFEAKANITKWQKSNDYFIFNNDFPEIKRLAERTRAKTISFERRSTPDIASKRDGGFRALQKRTQHRQRDRGTRDNGFWFMLKRTQHRQRDDKYFLYNTLAAMAVASLFKISSQKIKKSIKIWKTFEHRLESVGKFRGINFYNDSAATIPEATMAALESLEKVQTLILGGSEKGSDFRALAKTVIDKRIKTVILFPKEGKRIWQEISRQAKKDLPQHFFVNKMKEAVKLCFQYSQKGSVCLLSPACASFTTFKNYQDRGEQFKKYVKQLAKK